MPGRSAPQRAEPSAQPAGTFMGARRKCSDCIPPNHGRWTAPHRSKIVQQVNLYSSRWAETGERFRGGLSRVPVGVLHQLCKHRIFPPLVAAAFTMSLVLARISRPFMVRLRFSHVEAANPARSPALVAMLLRSREAQLKYAEFTQKQACRHIITCTCVQCAGAIFSYDFRKRMRELSLMQALLLLNFVIGNPVASTAHTHRRAGGPHIL